ncbi:MAG: UBA/ThiF-type NAD/FAD binding protein [uncultured bacterium]|nr:MAG: UBA/ThiF-type NAD/FAD binding protein [uncultured bacterium]HAO51895.1 hypothetical protein [Candidatus Magasanikbacteria bacterium]
MNKLKNKPFLINVKEAHASGIVSYQGSKAIIKIGDNFYEIPESNQFDLTQATIFGLNERLTMSATSPVLSDGETLRDKFNEEWEKYGEELTDEQSDFNYGVYAYYQEKNHLVRYSSEYWHRTVSIASSSTLILDPDRKKTWREIREIFENTVVGVVGCSVGSNIAHNIVMDLRPKNLKLADKSLFKMENINRVRLGYSDIVKANSEKNGISDTALKNKATSIADQMYAIDPFLNIYVYNEGLNDTNISDFFDGGDGEPKIDILVEEVDDPRIKLKLREEARKRSIPLVMASDLGSCVQIDICRYDLDNKESYSYGISDEKLLKATEAVYSNPGDRKTFFEFVDALVGTDYRQDELKDIINEESEIPTSTIIPQLGSTAAVGGGIMAELVARIRLGYNFSRRMIFNKKTFEVSIKE